MIFTMNFHFTNNVNAPQSNLTRLQAGDLNWLHSEDRRFGKTCWRGYQSVWLRFGQDMTNQQ